MSRTTTFLALLLTLIVIIAFLTLGMVLKMCGYPDDLTVRWNPLAVLLREHGEWLLLLPALWVCFAIYAERIGQGIFSQRMAVALAVCIAAVVMLLFVYAAVRPYTRPRLYSFPPSESTKP